ncbi:hypothetical protein RN001_001725 [Aquatica leii]|uniref:Uncharacterized protein n=1 Tax=Aquatica leii TaxID=1421715 RepID=A0AAN7Q4H9_9COLE|nr:hypothetical protein RN001_001725 [Aquatica leii]
MLFINICISIPDDSYNNKNILQSLTEFFKNQYPNIALLKSKLEDLQYNDILIIYSLLLHYTCMYDRRTCFTFPLCHLLSRDYQICIRTFLENITTKSTIDRTFDAIRRAVNKCIKSKDIYTNTSLNVAIGCSPLQELLNVSESLENLEVLQILEEDIELEENALLQESGGHKQNNELSINWNKLKVKIDTSSQWTFKFDYDLNRNDANSLQQNMRCQIRELEESFQKIQTEQVYLQKEREVIQKRIETFETNELFQSEQPNDLNNFYWTLMELNNLIEAVQQTKSQRNPVLAILNSTGDNQKNITNLLQQSLENAYSLKTNIGTFHTKYNLLENNYKAVKNVNDDFEKQVSIFCDSQKELDYVRVELEASAKQLLSTLKQQNFFNINKLEEGLDMSTSKIENLLYGFNEIINEPIQMCQINECCINPIGKEILKIETHYSNLLSNFNEKKNYLSSIEKHFNTMKSKLEKQMQTLEELFYNSNNLNISDAQHSTKNSPTDITMTFQKLVHELKLNVMLYSNKTNINPEEYQILNDQLKLAWLQVPVLEDLILKHTFNIDTLDYNIFQTTNIINELQKLQNLLLNTDDSNLNIKLLECLQKLNNTILLDNFHESIKNLEGIKTDIGQKVTTLKNTDENTSDQNKSFEFQTFGTVLNRNIIQKTEEAISYIENVNTLQANIEMLRQEVSLLKSCQNESKCSITVKCFQKNIKDINAEIKYYQTSIYKFELNLQILRAGLNEAYQDLKMLVGAEKDLQDIIAYFKNDLEKRIFIVDQTIVEIEQKLTSLKEAKNMTKLEQENLIKQKDCDFFTYNQIEIDELVKTNALEEECTIKLNLSLIDNYEFLIIKRKLEKKNYLNTLRTNVSNFNETRKHFKQELLPFQNHDYNIQQKCKILNTQHLILTNLKHTLEEKYDYEIKSNLIKLECDLSRNKNQLHEIIRCYKKHQEDIIIKIGYFKSALFENYNELHKPFNNHNVIKNLQKSVHIYDQLYELNVQLIDNGKMSKKCIKYLRENATNIYNKINMYFQSLDNNYEYSVSQCQQLDTLKLDLCQARKRNEILDAKHDAAISQLEVAQNQVESLECKKLEFEAQLLRQSLYFEEAYEKNANHLNLQIKELNKKEVELKAKLAKNMNEVQESNSCNSTLRCEFNVICTEFANLKDDKAFVGKKLSIFDFCYRELKEDFHSFSNSHLTTLKENYQKMIQLQNELLRHVEMLLSENINLKTSIVHLQNYVIFQQSEHEYITKDHLDNLKNMDNEKTVLKNLNHVINLNIQSLIKEKDALQIKTISEKKHRKSPFILAAFLSAKDIFETRQRLLEKDIDDNLKKIETVEKNIIQEKTVLSNQLQKNNNTNFSKTISEAAIQNIQAKNNVLSKKIASAKEVIEQQKEKLSSIFLERQTLDLEIQTINEKIRICQNQLEKDDKIVFDVTQQGIEKLHNTFKLQTNRVYLQNKIKTLDLTLQKITTERNCTKSNILKNVKIVAKIHKNTSEIYNYLLNHISMSKNDNFREISSDVEKLIEAVKVTNEFLNIHMLSLCTEKYTLLQLYFSLHHYINSIICIFKENPIKFVLNRSNVFLNISDHKVLSQKIDDVEKRIIYGLTPNTESLPKCQNINPINNREENLINVYSILSSAKVEQYSMFNFFLHLQKNHNDLTRKFNSLLESCEDANNVTQEVFKISENIIHIEKEATKLYSNYKKFDGYPIAYAIVLNQLILERDYLENVLKTTKWNLQFLLSELSSNHDSQVLEQLQLLKKKFYDIYSQFIQISRKLYEIVQTIIVIPFNINNENFNQTELFKKESSNKIFTEIKQCCTLAKKLLKQLQLFKREPNFQQIHHTIQLNFDIDKIVNLKQSFTPYETETVKKNYELLRETLYSYYVLDIEKQTTDFNCDTDSHIETNADITSIYGSNKRIKADEDIEEILEIKKAKLDISSIDLEKMKSRTCSKSLPTATSNDVDQKQNNFTFLRNMQHKAVETFNGSNNQKTNFGQQFLMSCLCIQDNKYKCYMTMYKKEVVIRSGECIAKVQSINDFELIEEKHVTTDVEREPIVDEQVNMDESVLG